MGSGSPWPVLLGPCPWLGSAPDRLLLSGSRSAPQWLRCVCSRQASVRADRPRFLEGGWPESRRQFQRATHSPILLVKPVHLLMEISNQNSVNNIGNPANKMQSLHPQSHQAGTLVFVLSSPGRDREKGAGRAGARRLPSGAPASPTGSPACQLPGCWHFDGLSFRRVAPQRSLLQRVFEILALSPPIKAVEGKFQ